MCGDEIIFYFFFNEIRLTVFNFFLIKRDCLNLISNSDRVHERTNCNLKLTNQFHDSNR